MNLGRQDVRELSILPQNAREIRYPVVLKVLSDRVIHGNDIGRVVQNVSDVTTLLQEPLRVLDRGFEQISILPQEQVGPVRKSL